MYGLRLDIIVFLNMKINNGGGDILLMNILTRISYNVTP